MTPLVAPQLVDLPEGLALVCMADGAPRKDMLALVSLLMATKNTYNLLFGPSDDIGRIDITRSQLEQEMQRAIEVFPQDYADLSSFAGTIVVSPMNLGRIEKALEAHDLYQSFIAFPPAYQPRLQQAWTTLYKQSPKRLSVEAGVVKPDPRITVVTEEVMA